MLKRNSKIGLSKSFMIWGISTKWLLLVVVFSHQVVSDSSQPHRLQHARLPSLIISRSLPKFISIELMMPSNHFTLCYPLLLPSVSPSIRIFSKVDSARWPKYSVSAEKPGKLEVGVASRDSTGFGALEEGLISS